ncbi:unnamed protein product [Pleuronectes platessa]|uniref:Uncharacterized protein n=1 Tax=Pleuronectes platessa TaxID=8262 RepID=A0A9N7W0M6_PLEPL|nr:unnamed protein product [Pleuronectes platessa]
MEEEKLHVSSRESSRVICLQVLPSHLLAGLGMVTAGLLLDQAYSSRTNCVLYTQQQHHVSVTDTHKQACLHHREPSRLIYPIREKNPGRDYHKLHTSSVPPSISDPTPSSHPGLPLIKMRKGLHGGQAHAGHLHSSEEKERDVWREKEEKEQQHRRAEKKLLAFWMSLSYRTWTFFRPRERPSFQRSSSAARLLKSEA